MADFESKKERLAKYIAAAGRASRRDAEKLITEGRVSVNGRVVDTPVFKVGEGDQVRVDGEEIARPALRLWLYHKPAGLVSTARDEKGRKTVFDELPTVLRNVNTIGRLDLNSEGLLLLTNHGGLKRVLELPKTGWRRKYRVRAYGKAGEAALERLRAGIEVDGERFLPMEVVLEREQGDNAWFVVALREGKNREIRRAFEEIGLKVNRLIRVSYGPFQLGALEKGGLVEMRAKALRTLLGGLLPDDVELADAPLDLEEKSEEKSDKKRGKKLRGSFGNHKKSGVSKARNHGKEAQSGRARNARSRKVSGRVKPLKNSGKRDGRMVKSGAKK